MTKRFYTAIVVSLALNFTLLGLLMAGLGTSSFTRIEDAQGQVANERSAANAPQKIDPAIWPAMQTDPLPAQIDHLRTAGFPPEIIYAIISARLDEAQRPRFETIPNEEDATPFWKLRQHDSKPDLARRELYREKRELLTDLLGKDAGNVDSPEPLEMFLQRRLTESVPKEKLPQVQKLMSEFDEKRSKLESEMLAPGHEEKLVAFERGRRAAFAQVLSPTELFEYELRMSKSSSSLSFDLTEFEPSEAEFRRIFPLWQSFHERFGEKIFFLGGTSQQKQTRAEARRELTEQVKAAFGPQRAEDYERETDWNYRSAKKLVERLQLPVETAHQLWSVQKATQQRAEVFLQDGALSPEERARQIATLAAEAKAQVTASLGERYFQVYQRHGGAWLKELQPSPAPPATK